MGNLGILTLSFKTFDPGSENVHVLGSVAQGNSCRMEEKGDLRSSGNEHQFGPEGAHWAVSAISASVRRGCSWRAERGVRQTPTTAAPSSHWHYFTQKSIG